MAPASKTSKNIKMAELQDIDAFCFICRGVLIKPVTLPCKHVFCYECFQESMTETSYSCPLCRRRLSNWVRSARKCNNLLDTPLWEIIQKQFKNEIQSKLAGSDDGLDERLQEQFKNRPTICPTGEIGSEYIRQIKAYEEELRRHREDEERASMELIKRIAEEDKEEENRKNIEIRMRNQEEQDRANQEARLRNMERSINKKSPKTCSKKSPGTSKLTPKGRKVQRGPMDKHIQRVLNQHISENFNDSSRSDSSGSGDSISSELNHFKPIRIVPKTPPKAGNSIIGPLKKITPLKLFSSDLACSSVNIVNTRSFHSQFSAFKGAMASLENDDSRETPNKKSKLLISEPMDTGILKEINLEENSDSNSRSGIDSKLQDDIKIPASCFGEENLSQLREEHKRLEKRLEQEKADRELALKLSRDWAEASETRTQRTQLPRTCRGSSSRQTTLLGTVIRTRRK